MPWGMLFFGTSVLSALRHIVSILAIFGGVVGGVLVTSGSLAAPQGLDKGVLLILLRSYSFKPDVNDIKDEAQITKWVGDGIRAHRPGQRIISFEEFQRVAFPRLTPTTAPRRPEFLEIMLRDKAFRRRIEPLNLKYIVYIGGVSEIGKKGGGGICIVGQATACATIREWDRDTRIGAKVLDIDRGEIVAETQARSAGVTWFAVVVIVPIGHIAETEREASRDLGAKIAAFLVRNRSNAPVPGAGPGAGSKPPMRKDKK